ncbi:MAG: TlpA family protein disulfide reductase [Bacteroidetes bacterium]|nr:TlpA family protein disulfide reductase [Bacteroidota bacterium]
MIKKISIYIFFIVCIQTQASKLNSGTYRGLLLLHPEKNIELPFNFDVTYKEKKCQIIIKNADEKIIVDEIKFNNDSVIIKMPVFDTEFRCKIKNDTLLGFWVNHYKTEKNKISFIAYKSKQRFTITNSLANTIFEGRWEASFSPGLKDSSKAIGIFHHQEQTNFITGTFLTETGDYRFLEGANNNNTLFLSCFDGSHAFLFTAEYKNGKIINGKFYSAANWEEDWTAIPNDTFKLRDANNITFAKDKSAVLNFSFPDLEKKLISLSDKKFKNKPVLIQVMGSWCPNCMDETAYLSELYKNEKFKGLEIIALAFERTNDFEKAKKQVARLKNKFNVTYPILITKQSGKEKASDVFNTLNKIIAFPTLIYLNKNHQIIRVHTGFSGPATGKEYIHFKEDTESLISRLLQ